MLEDEAVAVPFGDESAQGVAAVKNAGQFFKLRRGMHLTHDDVFKAEELKERGAKVEELLKRKKHEMWCALVEEQAVEVMNKPLGGKVEALLCHHGAEKSALTEKHLVRSVEGDSEG